MENSSCSAGPQFKSTLNGKPASVKAELGPQSDQVILVVLDLTGDLSRIDGAKQALKGGRIYWAWMGTLALIALIGVFAAHRANEFNLHGALVSSGPR